MLRSCTPNVPRAVVLLAGVALALSLSACAPQQGWGGTGYRPPGGGAWQPPSRSPSRPVPPGSDDAATDARCPVCGLPVPIAALRDDEIDEASGIVASSRTGDVFYMHNDSGDSARFFAVDRQGATRATFHVPSVLALDWEGIARGPCDGGASCLFLGDIGDNLKMRGSVTIVRVPEPDPALTGDREILGERMVLPYPEGPQNAEALMVHPRTGAITIVTRKGPGKATVFEHAAGFSAKVSATLVNRGLAWLPEGSGAVSAGDVHPEGRGVLLRTGSRVLYYPMAEGQSAADVLVTTGCDLPSVSDGNGEAIAVRFGGGGYVMVSEGRGSAIHSVSCTGM